MPPALAAQRESLHLLGPFSVCREIGAASFRLPDERDPRHSRSARNRAAFRTKMTHIAIRIAVPDKLVG